LEDFVSQQENAMMAVNERLMAAQQDSQKLRFQLDDALRRAADEQERLDTQRLSSVHLNIALYFTLSPFELNSHLGCCYL